MIKLYDKTGEVLIGELDECISCNVTEVRNGIFDARLVYPAMRLISNSLIKENIIVCKANDILLNQKFRIFNIKKKHSNTIEVVARHISFDLLYDFVEDISIVNQSCEYALNTIFRNSQFSRHYKGHSDIVNAQDYNMSMANCLNAIAGKEGSIIDTYGTGAEILRDNENIHVLNRRGHDNGVTIEYGKNLEGFECIEDTTDLITRIYPFAKKTTSEGEITVKLDEKFIDSPRITLYSHPYIKEIDFTSNFKDDEEITQAKLRLMAEKYFIENKCDIPKLTFDIKPVPLSKCVGFENLGESLSLCDIATINHKIYGIITQAKVIKTVFNVLTDRYENIQLGDPKASLGDIIGGNSNSPQVGPPGPPGQQGPPGEDANMESFPDTLPNVPQLTANVLGFASVDLSWTYENKIYYNYQIFASKTENFEPNVFDLVFEGQASSFLHQVKPNEIWYYRARAINTHGKATGLSSQVKVETRKIDDMSNYFEEAAIGKAVIRSLTADYMEAGIIKGHWVDARNLTVTDGNGKRTLDIDSYGNVYLDVKTLKVNSKDVATLTQLEQLNDEFNFKVSNTGSENMILNSNFDAEFKKWELHGKPTLSTHNPHLSPSYGKMVTIQSTGGGEGIYQRFPTIPGQKYTVSFYAESDELRPLHTTIGIEDVHLVTLVYEPGFKRWHFTFKATEKQHTFVAYLGEGGKFYLGRVMVNQGEQLQEYRKYTSEIYSTNVKFDIDGMEIDSTNAGTKNRIDAEGMKILNKSDNSVLLEIIQNMIKAKGGAFIVDHKEQGYTKLWGRDIEINGQRALVGTNSKPQDPLKPNKLYVNYNNDFINGVEIAGDLTNNTKKIISDHNSSLNENGFVFLSNGLKLQWGKVTINIQNGKVIEGTVNFPTPFPGACIIFHANLESVDNNNYWSANYNIVSKPFNRFAGGIYGLNLQKYIEQQGAVAQLSWFAIGV